MVSKETLLNDPDWNKLFDIHTDASPHKQLGVVISPNKKPITFLSPRLLKAQRNYTMTERNFSP
jgi:hypothetical protein